VNSILDANVGGWNSDGRGDTRKMGADLGYNTKSMPAFLGAVAQCLQSRYKLAIDQMSMTACISATVAELKYLVLQNTT